MSLHRYVVPPPLALAIEPAPPPKPHKDHKPDSKDSKDPQKDDKPAAAGKAGGTNDEDKHKNQIAEAGVKAGDIDKEEKPKAPLQTPTPEDSPVVPPSPGSMIPEPGTPRLGAEPPKDVAPVPGPREAVKPAGQQEMPKDRLSEEVKSPTTEDQQEVEQHIKVEPLWLLTPAPHRPLRTRLQLNPDKPYPPINTDPRGAYFKYARGVQAEWILIDVTKDGWLVDQWREKPEREALARLKGEADKQRDREVEALERRSKIRQVPKTSEEILLHLWNDLAEAPSYEIVADEFWARYDWNDPDAALHQEDIKRPLTKEQRSKLSASPKEGDEDDIEAKSGAANCPDAETSEPSVPWTCAGLEEVLATVGIQCAYKTEKPLSRHWAEPAGAYMLMAHGFFMLRVESHLQWKTEEAANHFEVLKTSHHDRVFGEMVKAQQMQDRKKKEAAYYERKMAEKKKAEEEAANAKAEGREPSAKVELGKDKKKDLGEEPDSPASNVKVRDGIPVNHERETKEKEVDDGSAQAERKNENVIVAIPVKSKVSPNKDDKHDQDIVAVAPGKAREAQDDQVQKKDAEPDAEKKDKAKKDLKGDKKAGGAHHRPGVPPKLSAEDAKLLKEMIHGIGGVPDSLAMEDIHLAFKAIEKAAERTKADEKNKAVGGPLIWTWQEPCEKWRWRNFEAGLSNVAPGGWEERDWKVFADGRGCEDFDTEEGWAEEDERDVHDWSC